MKDIVAELQKWRDRYTEDHGNEPEELPPTEGNVLRQFVYCVIADFLEDGAGDIAFYDALRNDDDGPLAQFVDEWVVRTYGDRDA